MVLFTGNRARRQALDCHNALGGEEVLVCIVYVGPKSMNVNSDC